MIRIETITRKSETNELLASEKWPILATFSRLGRITRDLDSICKWALVTWYFDPPQQYKSAVNVILHELSSEQAKHYPQNYARSQQRSYFQMNIIDHFNARKPWMRYKLQEFSRSAKRVITVLISKLTIIQAYTDVIYTHTKKDVEGAGPPQWHWFYYPYALWVLLLTLYSLSNVSTWSHFTS